jgi:hypothetical protein
MPSIPRARTSQRFGELLAVGQRNHPADTVADEHRALFTSEREHGIKIGRHVLEPVIIVVRFLR